MIIYKCRVECFDDVLEILSKAKNSIVTISYVEFENSWVFIAPLLNIWDIHTLILKCEDCHVAHETLQKISNYTGERISYTNDFKRKSLYTEETSPAKKINRLYR